MTHQLTKKQHFVPNFYLKAWTGSDGKLHRWDLKESKWQTMAPKATFTEPYFYEEDAGSPDNRVENVLGKMESDCAPIFKTLNEIAAKSLPSVRSALQKECDKDPSIEGALKRFIVYQYLRVPGAIDHKRGEIEGTTLSDADKEFLLNPGRFVESGYDYVAPKFNSLKVLLSYSQGKSFLTSDWPCFDIKDADEAPILGEEIGTNADVVMKMPIGPKLVALLYHRDRFYKDLQEHVPTTLVVSCPGPDVNNMNALMVQQAERFIVSDRSVGFVANLAKKRKKTGW